MHAFCDYYAYMINGREGLTLKLAVFESAKGAGWGRIEDEEIVADLSGWRPSLATGLESGLAALKEAPGEPFSISQLNGWRSLATRENRVFCIGVNYGAHAKESGRDVPEHPSVFLRSAASFTGHGADIVKPAVSDSFDYEAELGVIIGKPGRSIREQDAMDHIAGYTCIAENSVRDFQRHSRQVTAGKNFDGSGAIGPYLVTADEIDNVTSLTVRGLLNGEEMQSGAVSDLIYPLPRLIAYISTFTRLETGDIISTGTPEGVGASRKPPRFLKNGDVFEVAIDSVGLLRNQVIDETNTL